MSDEAGAVLCADAVMVAARERVNRGVLAMIDPHDPVPDLPYEAVLMRLLAVLAEELVRARKEPDARV